MNTFQVLIVSTNCLTLRFLAAALSIRHLAIAGWLAGNHLSCRSQIVLLFVYFRLYAHTCDRHNKAIAMGAAKHSFGLEWMSLA